MDKDYFDTVRAAQATGEPVAVYTKGIIGKVGAMVVNPLTGKPEDMILQGVPGKDNPEDYTITIWTEFEHTYFRKANRILLEGGYLIPAKPLEKEEVSVNEISDEDLREILSQKFFSLKAFLNKVTSEVPVQRALRMAEEMNKAVGTIDAIKKKLSEMQRSSEEG